jgi:pyrroloquinoline quinone (PQQ) biosynthesis protein C
MPYDSLSSAIDAALEGRRLLEHPFYQRWEAGTLEPSELAAYAEQYRHVEQALPGVLADIVEALPEGPARHSVAATLADELGSPRPHVELFEDFATSMGARAGVPASPATARLIAGQRAAAVRDPWAGLATLAAYEVQASAVASSKGDGLRRHYGTGPTGTAFWDVHATLEADHADWSLSALAASDADPTVLVDAVRAGADAWWEFLDERQAAAPVGVES